MEKEKASFWKSLGWCEWTVIAAVLAVAAGVAAILSPEFRGFIANSTTAAWAQAVGLLITVAVGVHTANKQAKTARVLLEAEWDRETENTRRSRINSIRAIVRSAETVADNTYRFCAILTTIKISPRAPCRTAKLRLETALHWLDRMPWHESPGILIAKSVLNLRLRAEDMLAVMETIIDDDNVSEDSQKRMMTISDSISRHKSDLAEFADIYNGGYEELRPNDL